MAATVALVATAVPLGACSFDPAGANLLPAADDSAEADADLPMDPDAADDDGRADAAEAEPDARFDAGTTSAADAAPDAAAADDCYPGAQIAVITPGVSATGSNVGQASGTSGGGTCGGTQAGEDVYTFALDERADVTVTTALAGTSFDTVLYVRTACIDLATTLGCASAGMPGDTLHLQDVPPGDYFAIVDGRAGATGSYEVRLTVRPIRDEGESCDPVGAASRCDEGLSCQVQPDGGGFACVEDESTCEGGPQTITLGPAGSALQQGTTSGASGHTPACVTTGSGAEKRYLGVVAGGGVRDLVLEVTSTSQLDPVAEITAGCGAAVASLACSSASSGASSTEVAVVNAVAPGDYFAVVDGSSGSSGSFTADFYLRPVLGVGAACDRKLRENRCGTGVCVDGNDLGATPECTAGVPVLSESEANDSCEDADGPRSADFVYVAQMDEGEGVDVVALKPPVPTSRIIASVHGEGGTCPMDLALALTAGSCNAPDLVATSSDEGLGACPYIDANVWISPGQTYQLAVAKTASSGAGSYRLVVDFIP